MTHYTHTTSYDTERRRTNTPDHATKDTIPCPECEGHGDGWPNWWQPCDECDGTGKVPDLYHEGIDYEENEPDGIINVPGFGQMQF